MYIENNSALLQSLISQLSIAEFRSSLALMGNSERNLMGLRDLIQLDMISGDFTYGRLSDPLGLLLVAADHIRLTKRGALFSYR
ncbi:MAG: hypothetical protein ACOH2T_22045 [Pseudomonas sp.]|jgi:hypothetical protein|uniref:hypothetical protein n=1 Tax=Pseudomonas sp. UMAB-08 TaxID=1365375 RepID=UPI001C5A2780|nr:hypothetical protein [Pseudomonas sp. UMAB-08]